MDMISVKKAPTVFSQQQIRAKQGQPNYLRMPMKTLIVFVLLITSSAFACSVEDTSIYQVREESDFTEISAKDVAFPGYLFSQFESLGDFDYESCKDAVTEVTMQAADGSRIRMLYTNEDSCDGGNSYGIVIDDKTLAPVALINDSDISCL